MKNGKVSIWLLFIPFFHICVFAQSTMKPQFGDGITVRGGLGHLAIRDDYISKQKYSGILPSFGLSWLGSDSSSAYRLGFDYRGSSDIKNHNVSARVLQADLYLDFLHSVGSFTLFSCDVAAFLGPSTEIYLYYRQQKIATGGNALFNAYSMAMFFSAGINSAFVAEFSPDFSAEASARLALVGVGGRLADLHDQDVEMFRLVSTLSGLRGRTEILFRYHLGGLFLLKAGYRFEICQSTSWDYLLSASDNATFVVTVRI